MLPIQAFIQQHLATFKEFPPRQPPADFDMDAIFKRVMQAAANRQGN